VALVEVLRPSVPRAGFGDDDLSFPAVVEKAAVLAFTSHHLVAVGNKRAAWLASLRRVLGGRTACPATERSAAGGSNEAAVAAWLAPRMEASEP
jgi:hypothetical protein